MKENRLNNERGMILVLVLLLLMIIAVLGTMAINTSTIDVQIFGHQRRSTEAFTVAEAGVDVAIPVIENTLIDGNTPDFSTLPEIVLNGNLGDEILGASVETDSINDQPDMVVTMSGGSTARADVDRIYAQAVAGGSMEFAGGYEGIGASAAGGGVAILYRVNSEGFR